MENIETLKAARNAADKKMMDLTMKLLKLAPRNPKRIKLDQERHDAVTAWALAGRDLDNTIAKMKGGLEAIAKHPQGPNCIDCGDKRIMASMALK